MQKNVVILGAGFGGLRAALDLSKNKECLVTLIDRNASHLYYPALFEEAFPGAKGRCAFPLNEILKGTRVKLVQGTVQGINFQGKIVDVAGKKLLYDYLVLALGAEVDYFGIPGLKEYTTVLRSVEDARRIRERVQAFVASGASGTCSIMIGGAGATGVELAAALAYEFRHISKDCRSITLVEALPNVLSMFPLGVSQYAHRRLEELGVHLQLDTCIKEVTTIGRHPERSEGSRDSSPTAQNDKQGGIEVVLAPRPLKPGEAETELVCDFLPEHEKRMRPDMLIWTGGVRANSLIAKCGLPTDRKGRIEIDEHMRLKGEEGSFAIGDNTVLVDPQTKQPVPGNAQAALKEGALAAENIVRSIRGEPLSLYHFPKFPAIVPLGKRDAVALVGTHIVRGFLAHLLRQAADLRYFASLVGWIKGLRRL